MASVRRKERSPYWFACFYDENGNAKCLSTKSKNKKEAQRIADAWEESWQTKVTTSQAKVVLNNILEMVGAQKMATKTVGQLFDEWLAEKKGEVIQLLQQMGSGILFREIGVPWRGLQKAEELSTSCSTLQH